MGSAEIDLHKRQIIISSVIITYGKRADQHITKLIREEIEIMWNEPKAIIHFKRKPFRVVFKINAYYRQEIDPMEIYKNLDSSNNYFRIEEFAHGHISFVDGLGCNSGYFKYDNLYEGSTTAAHEYGHTLGLPHPRHLDLRGKGVPGIMYPRGTLVDREFQYDPAIEPGLAGGTMNPVYRKVKHEDIENLNLHKLNFENNKAIVGEFTNIFHPDHSTIKASDFMNPPIAG